MDSISFGRRPDDDRRISERVVFGAIAAALVAGIGIYNVIPLSSPSEAAPTPALVATTTTTAVAAAEGDDAAPAARTGGAGFGSGVAALEAGQTADQLAAEARTGATIVPGPTCASDVVTDAADDARGRAEAVLGVPLPGSGLGDLAAIAAGCSNADPTGPVLSFALELAGLRATVPGAAPAAPAPTAPPPAAASPAITVPGGAPVATTVAPATTTPAPTAPAAVQVPVGLPAGLADALAPEADVIEAGCSGVGYLAVLAATVPGAAVEVYGTDARTAAAQATALCALFGA